MTTIYFTFRASGGQARTIIISLATIAAVTVACAGLVWLLPRRVAGQDAAETVAAEPAGWTAVPE